MATERLVTNSALEAEEPLNWSLRPGHLGEYVGQRDLVTRLQIAIEASRNRREPMEHVLLFGPPGLGKTTLAHVIGAEMGTRVYVTSGPALSRGTDLVSALTKLEQGTSSSSTRSTACDRGRGSSSTRRWRISASTCRWTLGCTRGRCRSR